MRRALELLMNKLPSHSAALVSAPHHLRYLTGYPSGESWLLVTCEKAYFLTDSRYIEMAQRTVEGAECRCIVKLTDELGKLVRQHGITAVYVEETQTTAAERARLSAALPLAEGELDAWLSAMRLIKTEEELRKIEQAQALTEAGFEHILSYIREGVTEREVALELEFYIRRQGAQRMAFDTIVVSGANGSLPHGIPSDKPIHRGEFITMDFGAVVDGYHSDMTRTVALGTVNDEQRMVYDTVLRAQQASMAVLRAGLPCVEGDAAARRVIEAAGYGAFFGHGTGHGVGLEIHEAPRLSPHAGEALLEVGHVVTVEPGIYLPGNCGVRIENMVVITENGCRSLTNTPTDLLCL
ncbi:MAG: aminopeptidase P family protein [Clostridia bacterium]|nr:aminopeptidase P family protein [Clostridia bacterium]